MANNGISTMANKNLRQLAKLELARVKRGTTGRRNTLNLSQLPTVYEGDNSVTDNANSGGLVPGRPWT
jgi:hypothetical protein|tara:strand:- start:153 stop:356 length:204 start_codon:yes stop_codon:yes gene_type:complete